MLKLNSSRRLQAVLAGAIATAQPTAAVGYNDKTATTFDGDSELHDLNGVTAVDICPAPAAGAVRQIDYLTIRNYDSAQVTVTVRINQGGTLHNLYLAMLEADETLGYTHAAGWYVNNADGSRKSGAMQDLSGFLTILAAAAAYQPLDADLSAIAALSTTPFGRALLALADAAAGRTALGLGTLATQSGSFSGTSSGNNTGDQDLSSYATQSFVTAAVTGLLDFKGPTDCSTNPNYPAALKGDAYIVSVAGKIGGASGTSVDIGDWYIASADNAGGTEASVGTSWAHLEHNLVGALLASNNLSDLANAGTARTNLGLGTLATQSGTFSGTSSGNNTGDQDLSGLQITSAKDASGGYAGLTLFKINFKNALNTFTSFFTNANTAARTYTFPDKDIAVAGLVDITGTNSGTNTGDETGARVATLLHAATAKTTLVDADEVNGTDSASSFSLIRTTWANVWVYIKSKADAVYALKGAITGSALTMATGKLLGRSSASTGAIEEITVGSGLTLSAGTLSTSGGTGATLSANTFTGAQEVDLAVDATSTDGFVLATTTAATVGAQKFSPRVRWLGKGWKTTATAASQDVEFIAEVQPVQGAANPSGKLSIQAAINGGAFSELAGFMSTGQLRLTTGSATVPSLNFDPTNSNPLGFSGIPNNLYAIVNGLNYLVITSNVSAAIGLRSGGGIGWTSNATDPLNGANWDVGIVRNAAGILEINSSTAGTFRDLKLRAMTAVGAAATSGIGYGTGAGGAVTQITTKATGVTLNTPTGAITMNNAALAAGASVSFTLTSSSIAADDYVGTHRKSGGTAGSYDVWTDSVAAGSCVIRVKNNTAGSLSEAVVLTFAVIKGAVA